MFENLTTAQAFLVFAVVESIQMFILIWVTIKNNQLWRALINDPEVTGTLLASGIFGFLDGMSLEGKDKKEIPVIRARQQQFIGFLQFCAHSAMGGLENAFPELSKKWQQRLGLIEKGAKLFGFDTKGVGEKIMEAREAVADVQGVMAGKPPSRPRGRPPGKPPAATVEEVSTLDPIWSEANR